MPLKEILMNDSSMEPLIPKGATLFVAESLSVVNGDTVAVFSDLQKPDYIIRNYIINQDGTVLLQAPNPTFDSYTSSPDDLKSGPGIYPVAKAERVLPALKGVPPEPKPFKAFVQASTASATVLPGSDVLTFEEAELALKVRRTKMYQMLRSGELKASKVGKLWRIEKSSIQEYLDRCKYGKS